MRRFSNPILPLMLAAAAFAQTPPIIDVHMHAESVKTFGPVGIKVCPGDVSKTWPAVNPGRSSTTRDSLEHCPNPIYAAKTDEEVFETTKRLMGKYNITGVVSGEEGFVGRWTKALGKRAIPALYVHKAGEPAIDRVRSLIEQKAIRVIGEVLLQYAGLPPSDPSFEPYWALAEESDVPVGIHIGPGPPGAVDIWGQKSYRARLSDPLLLEDVLVGHPRLRVYVMHAGWPNINAMIPMLYTYPRLYVDTGLISWYLPRREFHGYLRRLVEAGFGDRILFGSDQMIWPQSIEVAIQSIESADFLTGAQKRDIFYNNAVRFLGVQTAEATRDFWNERFSKGTPNATSDVSGLLVDSIAGRKPGTALDLGMGEGRNALYLAGNGWSVTGVDISAVALESARKAAAARNLKIDSMETDLDAYDLGTERWDLITSFYMQDWHANSKTDIPARIFRALRPGGLVVIEGFGPPRLKLDELIRGFSRMRILRKDMVTDEPEWGRGQKRVVVRFVAEKPR